MAVRQNNPVIKFLFRTVLRPEQGPSDAQLLSAFIKRNDTDAFEALVQRHGPMVLATCRRLLRDYHDAEDAFQAVFLVLARKASSVKPRHMVANWLHGVAQHTARKANAMNARRRGREKQVEAMPERPAATVDSWHELEPWLDEALSRLPEKHRLPVILCDLEGKSIQEATRQLGWPQGTLAGRLARGRKALAKLLSRREPRVCGGTLAAVFAQNLPTSASVPIAVVISTVKAAGVIAAGETAIDAISPKVATLMEGVLKVMMFNKLKTITALLVMVVLIGIGGAAMTHTAIAGGPRGAPRPRSTDQPGPEADRVQKTYAVADLVIPVPNASIHDFFLMPEVKPPEEKVQRSGRQGGQTLENELIQMIVNHVEPSSWSSRGGKGVIEYYPHGHALVVNQSAENHERINAFLASLHRLQNVEVVVEVRVLSVSESFYPQLMETVNLEPDEPSPYRKSQCKTAGTIRSSMGKQLGTLNDQQVRRFLQEASDNPGANILQAPKMTLFDGQTIVVSVTDQQFFVTGVKAIRSDKPQAMALVPVNQPFELGAKFAFRPTVSADRRSIHLDVKANSAALAKKHVPQAPITLNAPPSKESASGNIAAVTQFIQVPEFERRTLDTKVAIRDGRTVVFGGWRTTSQEPGSSRNEFLKDVPMLDSIVGLLEGLTGQENLIGSLNPRPTPKRVVMLVTPRIVVNEEREEVKPATVRAAPVVSGDEDREERVPVPLAARLAPNSSSEHPVTAAQLQKNMVTRLLASYREACATGNQAEARKLAQMALALDPTCFQKGR